MTGPPNGGATVYYEGDELEGMARARRYFGWIVSRWQSHLSGTIVEFGAGIGGFSAHLAATPIRRLILVEPSPNLVARLADRFADQPSVEIRAGTLSDLGDELAQQADAVVGVNVLEHIDDDVSTLRDAYRLLRPGGALLLFVPACPFLYGSLDAAFGHVRRYTKPMLGGVMREAGFAVAEVRYVNLLGVLPWFIAGRILRRRRLDPAFVALADRTIIPVTAALERFFDPPLGQSLMAIGHRTPE